VKRAFIISLLIMSIVLAGIPGASGEDLPGAPEDFTAERDGARIFLSWEPPEGNITVLHYNVYRGTAPDDLTFYDRVDANYTAGWDLEVVRGWTYYYAISANGTGGEGGMSATVEVLPPSDGCSALVMGMVLALSIGTLIFAYRKGRAEG
jgi:hypothetical protein